MRNVAVVVFDAEATLVPQESSKAASQFVNDERIIESDSSRKRDCGAADAAKDDQAGPTSSAQAEMPRRNFADLLREARSVSADVAATMWQRIASKGSGEAILPEHH